MGGESEVLITSLSICFTSSLLIPLRPSLPADLQLKTVSGPTPKYLSYFSCSFYSTNLLLLNTISFARTLAFVLEKSLEARDADAMPTRWQLAGDEDTPERYFSAGK